MVCCSGLYVFFGDDDGVLSGGGGRGSVFVFFGLDFGEVMDYSI